MHVRHKPGALTTSLVSAPLSVGERLGEGRQGVVHLCEVAGEPAVVKFFKPAWIKYDTDLRKRLEHMIDVGSPSDRFLWPIDLVHDGSTFGYVMTIRPAAFLPITDLLNCRCDDLSFRTLATACFELSHNFHHLHSLGYSYKDINDNNVFFDPATGEIRITDNDNVSVSDLTTAVAGTNEYMAPEIKLGLIDEPNVQTDLYSLAVLLFRMLVLVHPMHGRRERAFGSLTAEAQEQIYHRSPVFMFDPADTSNAPLEDVHALSIALWSMLPSYVRALFERAFCRRAIAEPATRVAEREWREAMVRLRDSVFPCPACGSENIFDDSAPEARVACWNCRAAVPAPMRLEIENSAGGRRVVAVTRDLKLYDHHLTRRRAFAFDAPLAETVLRSRDGRVHVGLRNLSAVAWRAIETTQTVDVAPGSIVTMRPGIAIDFAGRRGRVV